MSVVGGRLSARLSARVRFVARLRAALEGGWISSPPGRKRWYKSWAESRLRPHATLRRPLFLRGAGAIC